MRQHMELGRRALVKDFYATLGKKGPDKLHQGEMGL